MPGPPNRAWPPGEAYGYLDTASRIDLAWEWLRRNPDFRALPPSIRHEDAAGIVITEPASPDCAARWGCLHVPDTRLPFTEVPVLWSAGVDPSVLRVIASPARPKDGSGFALRRWSGAATLVIGVDGEQALLLHRAGRASLRLDVLSGSLLDGPVTLLNDLGSVRDFEATVASLRGYLCLCQTGELPVALRAARQPLRRQILALRVYDALAEGASIRAIGAMLFGSDRVKEEWPGPGEALKSQCRRLIALARSMIDGGYTTLLR